LIQEALKRSGVEFADEERVVNPANAQTPATKLCETKPVFESQTNFGLAALIRMRVSICEFSIFIQRLIDKITQAVRFFL
jgi:hypothetical protein